MQRAIPIPTTLWIAYSNQDFRLCKTLLIKQTLSELTLRLFTWASSAAGALVLKERILESPALLLRRMLAVCLRRWRSAIETPSSSFSCNKVVTLFFWTTVGIWIPDWSEMLPYYRNSSKLRRGKEHHRLNKKRIPNLTRPKTPFIR